MEQKIDLDNAEFQDVWKLVSYTRRSVFMTGKAGTGKSTFLKYICSHTKKKHVVLAPTGIAAVNVGGQTLHSFFKLPFKPLLPDDPEFSPRSIRKRLNYGGDKVKLLREVELIIIDEISMVRADIIDFVDKVLRIYTGNMREPFGGKQMLLVGDIFQLEPVVTADMRDILARYYRQNYFFNAHAFEQLAVVPIELRKVYRQNDEGFISLLDRVRVGRPAREDIYCLNSRLVGDDQSSGEDGKMTMTLATRRDMVDAINTRHLNELTTPEVTYYGEVKGEFPESALPNSLELTLKVGAQVVFIKNDPERRWVNGTLGRVYMANDDTLMVETEDGEKHAVEPAIWENIRYSYDDKSKKVVEEVLGTFTQYPLRLAWALTIHKSQGLTFSNVKIDLGEGAFSSGQAYVGLSRCRSLKGLGLVSTINERDIFVNPAIVRFSTTFNDTALIASALDDARADDEYAQALSSIREGNFADAFTHFIEGLRCRNELGNELMMRFARRQLLHADMHGAEVERLQGMLDENARRFARLAGEYVAMGDECRREGMDPTPVIANYNKAIDLQPDCLAAWTGKGHTYFDGEAYTEALECFTRAAAIAPDDFTATFMAAQTNHRMGNLPDALDGYLKAESLDAGSAPLHERMADLYGLVGDEAESDRHRDLARKLRRKRKPKR